MAEVRGEYLGVRYDNSPGPARENHIAHVEIAMQRELPADYKAFLRATDGCNFGHDIKKGKKWLFEEWVFPVPKDMEFFQRVIEMGYMCCVNPADSLLNKMSYYDFHKRVSPGFIPIGNTLYDMFVCLSLRDEDYGEISIWHPAEEWPSGMFEQGSHELWKCADSFEEWWRSLRPVKVRP